MTWRARQTLILVFLSRLGVSVSASWARELTDKGAAGAEVAFRAESATARGFFITFRTDGARQTVGDTLSVEVIIEGSWRTSNDRLSILTVSSLWTRN